MIGRALFFALGLVILTPAAFAHCTNSEFYAGGGIAMGTLPQFERASGFQLMGGYCLKYNMNNPKIKTSIELGYLNSGNFQGDTTTNQSFQGVWSTALLEYKSSNKVHFLGRLGNDFGDDDGMIFGFGMAVNLTKFVQLRPEYIIRDKSKSLQFNLITEFH